MVRMGRWRCRCNLCRMKGVSRMTRIRKMLRGSELGIEFGYRPAFREGKWDGDGIGV